MKSKPKAIIFQVPEELKNDATKALDKAGISMSEFLRRCLEELTHSNKDLLSTFSGKISELVRKSV